MNLAKFLRTPILKNTRDRLQNLIMTSSSNIYGGIVCTFLHLLTSKKN